MSRPRIGAFFDVDKTILADNSGTLYLRALWDRGEVDWQTLAVNLGSYLRYKLNLLNLERWTESTMLHFKGQSERELEREAAIWFEEYVRPTIYPEASELIAKHRDEGHVVGLVSGANKFVLRPLADYLGVEHIMCTQLEVEEGAFTGRVVRPVCFGEGKIYWLQQLLEREGLDLVGHPFIVNPDPLLYREARRRRWPVRIFEAPAS